MNPKTMLSPGIRYMIISVFLITAMQLLVKALPEVPVSEIILFRSVISFVFCLFILRKNNVSFRGKKTSQLFLRGVFGATSLLAFFYTIHHIPLASAVTISHLSPFVIVFLAHLFLGEELRKIQWLFLLLSFVGVVLIKGFDSRISGLDLAIALSAAVFSGLAHFMVRVIKNDNDPWLIIFYFTLICIPITLPFAIWNWTTPTFNELIILMMLSLLSHFGQYFLTKAYAEEKASKLSVIYYLGVILSVAGGSLFYKEEFSGYVWIGFTLITSGVILNLKIR